MKGRKNRCLLTAISTLRFLESESLERVDGWGGFRLGPEASEAAFELDRARRVVEARTVGKSAVETRCENKRSIKGSKRVSEARRRREKQDGTHTTKAP